MDEQNNWPFLHIRGLVTRRSKDPSVDVVLRAFEPEFLTRVEVFSLEGSNRELGDLGKHAFSRARYIVFNVCLNELEVTKNISVVRGRERGQCKEETTARKYLQARSSMCVGQSNRNAVG